MYDTGATMGEKTSKERKATTKTQANHLPAYPNTKNRVTERVAASTPFYSYCRYPDPIPRQLMYQAGGRYGQKA